MTLARRHALSRRGFCLCCLSASAAAAGRGLLAPRKAAAELLGIVELINYEAARTPITIHRLRGNVAVLEGSGGNVAGTDGTRREAGRGCRHHGFPPTNGNGAVGTRP